MDDEQKRYIAELEGKVRELEERWEQVPWYGILVLATWADSPNGDNWDAVRTAVERVAVWFNAHAPQEIEP